MKLLINRYSIIAIATTTSYEQIILIPQFRSVIRKVTATSNAKALYTSER
ncbi:MAG: hypothetical protein H0U45_08665 [Tatlockia sp.]|nr:hypothetical protein [Tatlockia sp.]